ncbi:MAG TPA: lipid-transfer protein [Candidatus Binatia bacterium]|nr:lipid-transfer protein [Candidatus Binatia bacterium]
MHHAPAYPAHLPSIRDKAAIAGIGQTAFSKGLGLSEYEMAIEAIWNACDDAGISPREIDGLVRYDMEQTDEEMLLAALGNPLLKWFVGTSWGGGGSASVIVVAAAAIAAGMASTVLVYRSRARGKYSGYGKGMNQGGRYWEKLPESLPGLNQWHVPQGLVSAFQEMAMISMRHRIDYGTTDDQYADVAIAFRDHAIRNPNAVMRTPMTRADHHGSRMVSDPLRLFDCNIETDGAVAMIVTSTERAHHLRQPPAIVHAGAMAAGSHHIRLSNLFARAPEEDSPARVARQLWESSGLSPREVDVAFFYDFFTSLVIIALEQYGFCGLGEGGPFVEKGGLAWPDGRLVCNTNGGQLSEAFIHGFNNTVEAVRQIRGTSTSQVEGCEIAFVAGGNTDPTGAFLLRRG